MELPSLITQREKADQALFNKIASTYARKDMIPSSLLARKFQLECVVSPLLHQRVDTLLEIACGIGASAEYVKEYYERYVGVDYSEELIQHAREFHKSDKRRSFIVRNIKDLSPSDVSGVDMVLAVGALHHFTEIDAALEAIKSVAKPGGYFVGIEPQRNNVLIQFLRFLRMKIDAGYSSEQSFFTEEELYHLFSRHGFTDITLTYQGFFSPPFAQVPLYPQWMTKRMSQCSIAVDKWCHKHLPPFCKRLSWNIIVTARFP